ncbi:EamA family transporter [Microbacterium dauci]|uniref:DMT family transporter n=1 Tax=Microbacterium dauci TaxID=3048008 RepID=A0ABT6ZGG6_9MICO|nr:DMT family transporter [Microbacterium sp. LX3-4]MDJ1115234.1 DMT family transporter [Microbacterium sp. LX3-4]
MTHTAPHPIVLPVVPARAALGARGLLLAVTSALAFSISGPIAKPLLESGWSLSAVLLVRMTVAGLVVSPALIRTLRAQRGFLRTHWLSLTAFGLIPVVGCQLLFFSAMQRMPVAVALLIQYLAPVMLVLFVWARTRMTPSRAVIAGSVIAMVGLVLVVDVTSARFDLVGVGLALLAAVCVCVYFTMSERTGPDLPPLALASGGLLVGAIAMGILTVTGIMPFAAPPLTVDLVGLELPAIVPLLLVGVCTAAGYAFGVMAVPLIGSRVASFVGLSEVLFALMFAWILLAETPAPVQFLGGALILVGVVLVRLDARAAAAVSAPVEPLPGEVGPGIR